ncbi:MAG: methyltransferase domain-containing protein [Turneriella sp.]|nr:methyltransferase domain-containing protein [Turneriella sp.]
MTLPDSVTDKLKRILAQKSERGGEACLRFDPGKLPFLIRETFPGYESYALEIGCGWGEFTRAMAAANPGRLTIAVEKKLARVLSCGRSQKHEGLENIRYVILDVAWFFAGIFADETFDAITINFPDPWPKARHHKHRFISPEFAATLSKIARPGCRLVFATDNYPYTREAAETFEQSPLWKNTEGHYLARGHIPGRPVSFFEQLHRNEGAPIYFLEYEKT